jgi:hypothetical protein
MWRERSLKIGSREAAIGNGAAFRPNSVIRRATPAEFYKKGMSRKNFCLGRRASAWPQFPAHCVYVSAPPDSLTGFALHTRSLRTRPENSRTLLRSRSNPPLH